MLFVLADNNLKKKINKEQLGIIIDSMFETELKNRRALLHYMESCYTLVSNKSIAYRTSERIDKYLNYVLEVLKDAKFRNSSLFEHDKEEIIETLTDYIKVIFCIYKAFERNSEECIEVNEIDFFVDHTYLELFLNELLNIQATVLDENNDDKKNIIGKGINRITKSVPKLEFQKEYKQFIWVLSWFLYYKICNDDGIMIERS